MTIEQRVNAAVAEVVAATDPEQVVLFGSVAKGTAGPESDIDLLVIGDPARHADGKRTCQASGDQVDVFMTDRASAERYRYSAAYLEGIALEEGRTVYAKNPEQALAAGEAMMRRTLYDPDKAVEWVGEARDRLERFETDKKDLHKCEFWNQAEAIAGRFPGEISEADLKHMTKYTGEFLYPAQGTRKLDPRRFWERLESPIRKIVAYAERRVPELVKDTQSRIE